MPVTVRIPPPWRPYAGDQRELAVEGTTVREALASLAAQHPDLQRRLFEEDGALAKSIAVFVNQDSIGRLQGPDTPVTDTDRIIVLLAIAGGQYGDTIPISPR